MSNINVLADAFAKAVRPPPKLRYSEWAAEYFHLSPDSSIDHGRYKPWRFQEIILDLIGDPTVERVTILKSARVGFALALDTEIPTPSGFTTMGEIAIGDRVFDEKGDVCRVTNVSPIYVDHECYRLTFCDGTEVVADAGHRWFVECDKSIEFLRDRKFVRGEGRRSTRSFVVTTAEMAAYQSRSKRLMFTVPVAGALDLPDVDLPVPPYTMGMWLGDGHSVTPRITQHIGDIETKNFIEAEGISVTVLTDPSLPNNCQYLLDCSDKPRAVSPWARVMRSMGILHKGPGGPANKHIPSAYMRASISQRLQLLRGLMDSDGTIYKRGFAEFAVTSPRLASGLRELLASLGMKASISERPPVKAHHLKQYRVVFRPTPDMNPFNLPRKAARVLEAPKPTITKRRRIVSIERVDTVPVRCISVDSPSSLFLCTRQMIPTHNSKTLAAALGADAVNDPCPIILLLPTDDDARGTMVDEIDPAFRESPVMSRAMVIGRFDSRNTLLQRAFIGGGSLKLLSARSPRNLRRHTARKLYCDEVDAMEVTAEGDPIKLAINRTQSAVNRKIVLGSTPKDEETSIIWREYQASDQGVFQVPCPHCDEFFELLWEHIDWPAGQPEKAHAVCPSCGTVIEERFKTQMVAAGRRHVLKPEVRNHAGLRVNTLVSLQPQATWPQLAAEFEEAKKAGPALMQVFVNTVLGLPWSNALERVDENALMVRAAEERFGIYFDEDKGVWVAEIPAEVLYITAGVDVQTDRLEVTFWGWSRDQRWVLGHEVIRGATNMEPTWADLDAMLSTKWLHPLGNEIGIEAAAVDSGDGNRTQFVYDFCGPRMGRRIVPIKGQSGPRPVIEATKSRRTKRAQARLHIVGVDQVKNDILSSLQVKPGEPGSIRFSNSLETLWFEQFASEKRVVSVRAGKTVFNWERIGRRSQEALDASVYALAVRSLCRFDMDRRQRELTRDAAPAPKPSLSSALKRLHGLS